MPTAPPTAPSSTPPGAPPVPTLAQLGLLSTMAKGTYLMASLLYSCSNFEIIQVLRQ